MGRNHKRWMMKKLRTRRRTFRLGLRMRLIMAWKMIRGKRLQLWAKPSKIQQTKASQIDPSRQMRRR